MRRQDAAIACSVASRLHLAAWVLFVLVCFALAPFSRALAAATDDARRLQWDLIWTGHYEASVDGEVGPATRRAIRSYQLVSGMLPTGALDDAQRQRLAEEAAAVEAQLGWTIYRNPAAGYRIGYPANLLPRARALDATSQEFYRDDLSANLITMVTGPDSAASFRASYAEVADDPSHVTVYQRFEPNWFVVSFLIGESGYYVMSRQKPGATVSYVLRWPKAEDRSFRPVATAIANSFTVPEDVVRR
ncbi:peptidoglycan-binding domain-containing protein [Geminicoccus roseus]|uniref:peptidoglycan-binding domain-containing protein n=1 Tax=Geminicoccus roseus TaxID=404900 RepID=UPI0004092BFA|nr:peptidoglycan-binding domain-containing protein [Geminicoccus roseus]